MTAPRIFVSHSHKDNDYCREFVAKLRNEGNQVWYDEHDFGAGVVRATIQKELSLCQHFIAIFSPDSVVSDWVNAEIDAAIELHKRGRIQTILFVMARECDVPLLLLGWKRIEGVNGSAVEAVEAAGRATAIMSNSGEMSSSDLLLGSVDVLTPPTHTPSSMPTFSSPTLDTRSPKSIYKSLYEYTTSSALVRSQPYTPPPFVYPILTLQQVRRYFPRSNFTLEIPDMSIYPAELTYIGGESGSGKTTLLRMLTLERQPDGGNIFMMGANIAALTPDQRDNFRNGGITYIPQGHLGLVDNVTPVEAIARLLYDYDGIDLAEGERRAEVALTWARLPRGRFRVKVKSLSGGERARVAIAKAYATERPLCLADEILGALDEVNRIGVIDLFQDMTQDGYTVVIVTHNPEMMNRFHRVIEVEWGRIVSDQRYMPVLRRW